MPYEAQMILHSSSIKHVTSLEKTTIPRLEKYFAEHPVIYRLQEALGDPKKIKNSEKRQAREAQIQARQELGMGLKPNMAGKQPDWRL